jgi:hypothetical protein
MKLVSVLLTISMLYVTFCHQTAFAAIISTEALIESKRIQETRHYLNKGVSRNDARKALLAQGIDPMEVKAGIDGLTDEEIARIADQIEQLPAGADAVAAIVYVSVILLLVLLITKILGYTDIFSFFDYK